MRILFKILTVIALYLSYFLNVNAQTWEDLDDQALNDLFNPNDRWVSTTPHLFECEGIFCQEKHRSAFKFDGPMIKIPRSEHSKLYYSSRAYLANCYMHPAAQKEVAEMLDRVWPQLELSISQRARGEAWLRLDGSVTCDRASGYNAMFRTLDRSYR